MPVYRLSDLPLFPRPELADADGLLAIGGDLSIPRLIEAYALGIFPWYDEDQPILWWSPDPRLILEVEDLHVSRSLRKVLRQGRFQIRYDTDFEGVIASCADSRVEAGEGTWITPEMEEAYIALHRMGLAHSVEVLEGGALVGGLYGVFLGRIFCGESMFSRVSDASKVALVGLSEYLKALGVSLIDCQTPTDHLKRLGAREIPRSTFLARLREEVSHPTDTRPWRWPPPPPLPRAAPRPGAGGPQ